MLQKYFKYLIKTLAFFIALFLLFSVIVMTLIDINQYKNEISQLVKDETSLDLKINGDLYLSIFSGVKIKANDIVLSHNKKVIAHIDAIALGMSLTSLYNNKPEINSLEASILKLNLIRDKKGKFNFLPLSTQDLKQTEDDISPTLAERYFLESLSIKNIQLSIAEFQFLDKSTSLSINLESLETSLSSLQIIDHYELIIDDPRILVNYTYSGKILVKKALLNHSRISDLSLSFKAQKGNIIAEQLAFRLIQQRKGQEENKLDFTTKGKFALFIDYNIPKGELKPLWSQAQSIKLTEIDFKLTDFLLSQKEFQFDMKQSSLVMTELSIIENNKYVLKNLLIKSLAVKSDLIDLSLHSKDKYHFKQSVLKLNNLPIMTDNKLFDPLSHSFLTKLAHNTQINLSVDSIVENEEQGISHLELKLLGKDKRITLSNLDFNAIDSKINTIGTVSLQKKTPIWTIEVRSDKLNLKPISDLFNTDYGVEGYLSIHNKLSGTLENSDFKIKSGRLHAKASNIILSGIELDKIFNDFGSSQRVGLLDVGAVTLLGPAGIALSKGNDYKSLIQSVNKGGESKITQLNSDISWSNDIASMDDVSFTTGKHHLVIKGKIDLLNEIFVDFYAAIVDKYGCSIYKESVTGSLHSPTTKKVSILVKSVVNPIKSITSRVTSKIQEKCREPFYNGALKLE